MDEVEAYANLLAEERARIVEVAGVEHRQYTDEEMARMALLDGAIDAIVHTENRRRSSTSAPALPVPQFSEPGSDYRVVAEKHYTSIKTRQMFSLQMAGEYGKWLVATVSAVHLGGIFFIGSLEGVELSSKEPALWALVLGLLSILGAGFATYFNWGYSAILHDRWSHPDMLIDSKAWPAEVPELQKKLQRTFVGAMLLGVFSALMIPAAAVALTLSV